MTTTKKRIPNHVKEDNICNICLETKNLSKDHIPPRSCPPAKPRVVSRLTHKLIGDESFQPKFTQDGQTYQTICRDCNNFLGSNYDSSLCDLSQKIQRFVESSIILPDYFEVECQPNAIIRSILGHLLAAKTRTDQEVVDQLIRPCILNPYLPVPEDIHVFYWVYPYDATIIFRDFMMPSVRGKIKGGGLEILSVELAIFSLIKFYPIAFLVTYQLSNYERLESLHNFNNFNFKDIANITINLNSGKYFTWPEECRGTENYLVWGKPAEDALFSVPHLKGKTA